MSDLLKVENNLSFDASLLHEEWTMVDGLQKGIQRIVSESRNLVVDLWAYKLDCMMSWHAMVDDLSKNTSRKDKSIGCNQLFHRTLHSRVIALNWFSDIWPLFNFSIAPTLGVWWNSTKVILNSEPHLWKDQHRLETTWKNYLYPIGHLIKILLRILKPIVQCFSEESSFQCLVVNGKSPWQNIHVTKSW